jgi:hypothetical protein
VTFVGVPGFQSLPDPGQIPKAVTITEKEYVGHIKAYYKAFEDAAKRSGK